MTIFSAIISNKIRLTSRPVAIEYQIEWLIENINSRFGNNFLVASKNASGWWQLNYSTMQFNWLIFESKMINNKKKREKKTSDYLDFLSTSCCYFLKLNFFL